MNIDYRENEYYAAIEPYISRLFINWVIREWSTEGPQGRQYFVIDGDFCSLIIVRERDFQDTGYLDIVSFGPIGNISLESYVEVSSFQHDLGLPYSPPGITGTFDWLIDNSKIVRHCVNPRTFDLLKRCFQEVNHIFESFTYKYLAKSEYSLDSEAESFVSRRALAIMSDEVRMFSKQLRHFHSMARLICAASRGLRITSVHESQDSMVCRGSYLSLTLAKIDGFEKLFVCPLEENRSRSPIDIETIADLLFTKRIESTFVGQLKFLIRYRETFEEMTACGNWSEIEQFVDALNSTRIKYQLIALN